MAALRGRRGRLRWGQVQQGPHTSSSSSEESGACEGTRGVSAPRAISARCLRTHIKRTLTSSLTKRFTRGLLVLFRTLGKIQIHSFKSHLKRCTGSRAVPKTWCAEQQTSSCACSSERDAHYIANTGIRALSSGTNQPPRNMHNPTTSSLIKNGPCGAEQQQKQAVDANDN